MSSRPAQGVIYLKDLGSMCNKMKRVCKVNYSSHCVLVELLHTSLARCVLVYIGKVERENGRRFALSWKGVNHGCDSYTHTRVNGLALESGLF
jgi:hypothetical protein